jgi:antitoxin (DNA-binding transcriptional repressor) of toxin-antitoxin stability system
MSKDEVRPFEIDLALPFVGHCCVRCHQEKSGVIVINKGAIMSAITVAEAQARLRELINNLAPGEEITITDNQRPVAKLVAPFPKDRKPRKAGSAKGKLVIVQEDDEHLEDFEEYMR